MRSFKSRLLSGTIKSVKPLITGFNIPRQRQGMELLKIFRPKPKDVQLREALGCPVSAKWAVPDTLIEGKAVLYTHGGSYVSGSPETHIPIICRLAEQSRFAVLAYDYRLAPEHPFPAALEDAVAAFDYLLAEGYTEKDIVLCGDSAGGGLTLALVMKLRELGRTLPAAVCVISPWTDLTESGDSHYSRGEVDPMISSEELREAAALYAGTQDLKNPYISPLFGDFTGFPPTLIQVGGDEVLLDDSRRLAERMQAQGAEAHITLYEGLWHVFHMFDIPEAYHAIEQIALFFHRMLEMDGFRRRVVRPGAKYRHFKGKEYRVLAVARHSETMEEMVVYQQLYGEKGVWVRPLEMFLDVVERDGRRIARFEEVAEDGAPAEEPPFLEGTAPEGSR